MTRLLSSLAARARSSKAAPHYGRAYIFLVVALTVFLLGLVCWRQPVTGYTARVGIVQRENDSERQGNSIEFDNRRAVQLREQILAPKAWRDVAGEAQRQMSNDDIAALQQRTTVHVRTKPTGETHIALWHANEAPDQAIAVAQRLAERFAEQHSQQQESRRRCEQCDAAQAEVARAATAMQQAKDAVELFRSQHAAELSPTPASRSTSEPDAVKEPPASTTATTETPNPAWSELSDRLDVLRAAHAKLLNERTPEHPAVVDLAWQVEQAAANLAKTPRLLAPAATQLAEAKPSPAPVATIPTTNETQVPPSTEILDRLRRLTAVADAAERRHGEALAAERRAWKDRWSQSSEQIAIIEPAHIVQRHGGGPSKGGVLFVSLVAVVCGSVVAWRSQLVAQPASLVSVNQVERMGLAVVAALSTRDGPAIPPPQLSNPIWIRYLTVGCELALGVIVLMLAIVVLADWQIAAQAIWDPLTAFSDALWRLSPW